MLPAVAYEDLTMLSYSLVDQTGGGIEVRTAPAVHLDDLSGGAVRLLGFGAEDCVKCTPLRNRYDLGAAGSRLREHRPVPPEHICVQDFLL